MKRNRFLDVLKGICILFVVITHYAWLAEERKAGLFPFWIDMAVPIFMIISGLVYYQSFERNGINDFQKAYHPQNTLPKLVRYTVPFSILFLAQVLVGISRGGQYTLLSLIKLSFVGGQGPGSYYYPVMVQFVFLFPVIYMIVKQKGRRGLWICGGLNLAFEIAKWGYGMSEGLYRLLIFRYIFLIAVGCYIATLEKSYKPKVFYSIATSVLGILFVVLTYYMGKPSTIFAYWTTTCMVACLFIVPLAIVMLLKFRFGFFPLELVGKASFHIFLIQMLYYNSFAGELYARFENRWVELGLSIAICLAGGIAFYFLEMPLSKFLNKKIRAFYQKRIATA